MKITVTSVDTLLEELYGQTPFSAEILRQIPGPDRPDYFLAALDTPLKWQRGSDAVSVTHLIVGARLVGGELAPGETDLNINIAYVVDPSVLKDTQLIFEKCYPCAIGMADVEGVKKAKKRSRKR